MLSAAAVPCGHHEMEGGGGGGVLRNSTHGKVHRHNK